jgi:hypothetical protein
MSIIERQIAEAKKELSERETRWGAIKSVLEPIVLKLQTLEIEPTFYTDLNVSFTGDKHKLAAVIRIFRLAGWTSITKPKDKEPSWCGYFHKKGIDASVWVAFTSTICRRVKIGTKMVEQDIFEVVCGESNPQNNQSPVTAAIPQDDIPF